MPSLIMLVQFVLVIEFFRAQFATKLLLLVTTFNPLMPQQTVPPLVPLPTTETNIHQAAPVAPQIFHFVFLGQIHVGRVRLES